MCADPPPQGTGEASSAPIDGCWVRRCVPLFYESGALIPKHSKYLTGLIGAPIAASAAPAMHEQAAEALGVRCHYQLIEVAGADAAGLRALLDGVRRLGFAGVNVTFPYKEAVVPLLDEMSARRA